MRPQLDCLQLKDLVFYYVVWATIQRVPQFEFVAWLVKWILEQASFDFYWDHGNSTNEPRFGALGTDFSGRKISLYFTIREGRIRIISARPMSKIERKNYEQIR